MFKYIRIVLPFKGSNCDLIPCNVKCVTFLQVLNKIAGSTTIKKNPMLLMQNQVIVTFSGQEHYLPVAVKKIWGYAAFFLATVIHCKQCWSAVNSELRF